MAILTCGPNCRTGDPHECADPQRSYEGLVLATRERNGPSDSDFYAVVWDPERRVVREIEYATTRFWTYHNGALVDATPEARRLAARYLAYRAVKALVEHYRREAHRPYKGAHVRAVRTIRKSRERPTIPAGTEGWIFWLGREFSRGRWDTPGIRAGIELADGTRFFAPWSGFELVNPTVAEGAVASVRQAARRIKAADEHGLGGVYAGLSCPPGWMVA